MFWETILYICQTVQTQKTHPNLKFPSERKSSTVCRVCFQNFVPHTPVHACAHAPHPPSTKRMAWGGAPAWESCWKMRTRIPSRRELASMEKVRRPGKFRMNTRDTRKRECPHCADADVQPRWAREARALCPAVPVVPLAVDKLQRRKDDVNFS